MASELGARSHHSAGVTHANRDARVARSSGESFNPTVRVLPVCGTEPPWRTDVACGGDGGGDSTAVARHRLQAGDALLHRRMGREQAATGRRPTAGCRCRDAPSPDWPRRSRWGSSACRRAGAASAEASHSGLPEISAPMRSASYSRLRLIAICTSEAASGARIIAAMATIGIHQRPAVLVAAAAHQAAERRQHADRARQRGGDGHGERVAVADMAQLVRQHAGDLLAAEMASAGRC